MRSEIAKTVAELEQGHTILYPTDTIWGLGCDAENPAAVEQVYAIKERPKDKSFLILVSDANMLQRYLTEIPEGFFSFMSGQDRPTTYVFSNTRNLPSALIRDDGSIGIRIVQDEFCQALIQQFGRAIVSTSANVSGQAPSSGFADIPEEIKAKVDYIVNWRRDEQITAQPSRIVQWQPNGNVKVIRD